MKSTHITKRAIVIGATGLVGQKLTAQLLSLDDYQQVTLVVRKFQTAYAEIKKVQQIVLEDFLMLNEQDVEGYTHAFSCMGSTLKQAGSKENYYAIDYGINVHFAKLFQNTPTHYLLISAAGASAKSCMFYNKVKGQVEEDIQALKLAKTSFFRPSLLIGEHKDKRVLEHIAQVAFLRTEKFLPKRYKYKPVTAVQVAQSLVVASQVQTEQVKVYDNLDIQNLADDML